MTDGVRVHVVRKQRSSLGRTGMVRDDHGLRVYLPGPYLLRVRRHYEPHLQAPYPMPPLNQRLPQP